jgi:hypothetical protein
MSGRAGRRGLDARGIVIMMCEQKLEPEAAKGMVKGQADRLDSAFHLGYNMILNLMRVEGVSPEYMLERCFYQFQNTSNIPVLEDGEYISGFLDEPTTQLSPPTQLQSFGNLSRRKNRSTSNDAKRSRSTTIFATL